MTPLLELDGVTTELLVGSHHTSVLRDISFELRRGEALSIVGESGSGKSMLARTILRTLPMGARIRGRVLLDGQDMYSLSKKTLRKVRSTRTSMIFQDARSAIDPMWKVGDHIMERLRVHRGLDRRSARTRVLELLSEVRIQEPDRVADSYPHQLSGGMLQRVMIAGALSTEPELLIADEPTTALDVTVQGEIAAILEHLKSSRGLAMLFVTHDLDLAAMLCERNLVLYAGTIMVDQPTASLIQHAAHPYAQALLDARPRIDVRQERLIAVPGRPVSALDPPSGCPFHPRCEQAIEACTTAEMQLLPVAPKVKSSCIRRHGHTGHEIEPGENYARSP